MQGLVGHAEIGQVAVLVIGHEILHAGRLGVVLRVADPAQAVVLESVLLPGDAVYHPGHLNQAAVVIIVGGHGLLRLGEAPRLGQGMAGRGMEGYPVPRFAHLGDGHRQGEDPLALLRGEARGGDGDIFTISRAVGLHCDRGEAGLRLVQVGLAEPGEKDGGLSLGLGPAVEEGGQLLPAHRLVGAKGGGGQTCHNPGFPSPVHCLGIPSVSWDVQKRAGLARLGGSGQPPQKGGRHGPAQGSLGPEGVRGDPLHQVTVLGVLDAQGIPGGGSHVGKGGLPCRGGLDADQGKGPEEPPAGRRGAGKRGVS